MCLPQVAWLYQDGASRLFPDRWEEFLAPISPGERSGATLPFSSKHDSRDSKISA